MQPSDVVVFCCHIKRNLFFEESMERLWNAGFRRIWIEETGTPTFGRYQGPCEQHFDAPHFPALYDTSLPELKKRLNEDFTYLFWVDFDLFFSRVDEFKECCEQVEKGKYDHVSRFKRWTDQPKYKYEGQIAHVPYCKIGPGDEQHDWPELNPHFATGFEFYSKRLWDLYTRYDLGDTRRMMRRAFQEGMKMGAHWANYGPGEECWGKEWFHVSNLTAYYQMLDRGEFPISAEQYHQFRIGFFHIQQQIYGPEIYSDQVQKNLQKATEKVGGKDACLEAWKGEVRGTCMENWPHG